MSYQQTLDWMFSQLPMYQRIGASAFNKNLDKTMALAEHLNHPEHRFKSIHIAGTNGKGSTSSMIASILQESGYKVGLYTSPHLTDFRERIKINGGMMSEQAVVEFIYTNKTFLEEHQLSFFEMTVGMAFDFFRKERVDVAVVEAGMGGRLDSTNIIIPLVSVITNIGMDHVQYLGTTLAEIAGEKAGIIKENVPTVIGTYVKETKPVFLKEAEKKHSRVIFASDADYPLRASDMKGNYQKENIQTVQAALQILRNYFDISEMAEINGFLNVEKNTKLWGRWQILSNNPLIVADTAHNADGLSKVMYQVAEQEYDQLYVVFGVVNDKDIDDIVEFLPKEAFYFYTRPNIPRGLDAEILKEKMEANGFSGQVCVSVREAYEKAKSKAKSNDMIYVGGSTFVVAEIL